MDRTLEVSLKVCMQSVLKECSLRPNSVYYNNPEILLSKLASLNSIEDKELGLMVSETTLAFLLSSIPTNRLRVENVL